jgi:hypothetical protein
VPLHEVVACSDELQKKLIEKCGKSKCKFEYQNFYITAGEGRVYTFQSPQNAYFDVLFGTKNLDNIEKIASKMRDHPEYGHRIEYYDDDPITDIPSYIEIDNFVSCSPKFLGYYLHVSKDEKDEIIFSMDTDPFF